MEVAARELLAEVSLVQHYVCKTLCHRGQVYLMTFPVTHDDFTYIVSECVTHFNAVDCTSESLDLRAKLIRRDDTYQVFW